VAPALPTEYWTRQMPREAEYAIAELGGLVAAREIPTGPAPPVGWDPDDHVYVDVAAGGGGGLTLPLHENLTFSPDTTYDIGTAGVPPTFQPRDIYAGRDMFAVGRVTAAYFTAEFDIDARDFTANRDLSVTGRGYFGNKVTIDTHLTGFDALQVVGLTTLDGNLSWFVDNTYDIGANIGPTASRPRDLFLGRNLSVGGAITGNGSVPIGGTADQVLTKTSATDYALSWSTPFSQALADARYPLKTDLDPYPTYLTQAEGDARYQTPAQSAALYLPLAGGMLTGNLLFSADNTRDIGASGATRPRDLFVGRNLTIGSTLSVNGSASIAGTLAVVSTTTLGGLTQISGNLTFSPDATYDIGAIGTTRPRDIWLSGQVRTNGNAGFAGVVSAGASTPQPSASLYVRNAGGLTGTFQYGIDLLIAFSSAAVSRGHGIAVTFQTVAAAFTMTDGYIVRLQVPTIGAGSAVTNLYGLWIDNQGAAGVNSVYGIYISLQGGASTRNICLQSAGETVLGQSNIGAAATVGFVDICSAANAPTGVPAQVPTGYSAMRYDTTNHKLWFYDAGWKGVVVA
jgi:hypothetical protein